MKKRILSGMRPSGKLHLGNYLGALRNWVSLQDKYECFYMIADWHALMSDYEKPGEIKRATIDMALDWLACGLDPEKSTIFIQSEVCEHLELFFILSCLTPLSWLERCPTYKEALSQIKEKDIRNYAFLGYPVLQASDILVYKAEYVPVGEDQLPHLEMTREIARRLNSFYKRILPEPEALLTESPKVPGIDGRKMSKSYNNCIYLSDSKEVIRKKVNSMITDPLRIHPNDLGHPDVCAVYKFHEIFNPGQKEIAQECKKGKIGCVQCKKIIFQMLLKKLEPIQKRRDEFGKKPEQISRILKEGKERAREAAKKTIREVRLASNL